MSSNEVSNVSIGNIYSNNGSAYDVHIISIALI